MMNDVLKRAIDTYGQDNQCAVAIEEMSELIKELCKDKRGEGDLLHIAEEVADVEIMLEQIKMIYSIHELVEKFKDQKTERLEERIASHGRPD